MNTKLVKKISLILIFTLLSTVIPWNTVKAESQVPEVSAHAYVVMDANSGEVLYSEHETNKIYPASTVKLMTAIVAMEQSSLTKKITTKQSVLKELPSDASVIGLKPKNTYTLNQLLQMTLIVSAADAANTIAAGVSGSTKKFVKKMNAKAEELGMYGTSFDNAVGLDIGNGYKNTYTTAEDFAILTRYAMSKPTLRDIVAMKTYKVPTSIKKSGGKLKSTNLFYSTADYSKDRYTIIGSKTGPTNAAGSVLIATARDQDNHEIICAFFGNVNRTTTYKDIRKLIDFTFNQYDNQLISLSQGFYDVRYRDSEQTILKYCNEGLIFGNEDGSFSPESKINQKDFVDTVNGIAQTNLVANAETKNLKVVDFADMLMSAYPIEVSDEIYTEYADKFTSATTLSEENKKNLSVLYHEGILPKNYEYKADSYITKEDMVLIADKLIAYVDTKVIN
jgi:D-alanyl-D-alanine carboxypeptidase